MNIEVLIQSITAKDIEDALSNVEKIIAEGNQTENALLMLAFED